MVYSSEECKPYNGHSWVKNGILLTAILIKFRNCVDKCFIKKESESRFFFGQNLWCGGWDLNLRPTSSISPLSVQPLNAQLP